jgi:hypothetical protein
MKRPNGAKAPGAPDVARAPNAVEPQFAPLGKLPETPDDLFQSLGVTVTTTVNQPTAKGSAKTQRYALPWIGFDSWRDARRRLDHFEKTCAGKIVWAPFNDSESNDGPMSLNAYPGRAFVERVTNEGDANLELAALTKNGGQPASPAEAVERWFGLEQGALSKRLSPTEVENLAKETVTVTAFVGDPKDPKDCVLDARDFGIGLSAEEIPKTILTLNRGLKKGKAYLTGKHGQGASSTYQYSDLTLIASRKLGATTVAFTLVEGDWTGEDGRTAKTPTYRYLTIDGKVPETELPETDFPRGTLVRHIGYMAADLFNPLGENSLYGLLMRSLAEPLFPVWLEMYALRAGGKTQKFFKGFRRYGRSIRGAVNSLERAWDNTLTATTDAEDDDSTRILHRASEHFQLPKWDFGGRVGVIELGKVKINYWVADPAGRSYQDVLRNWVDPDKTIIMTLDGQTHAEESRAIVTGTHGAQLWAVGRYMVVQIDCNALDPRAKYEMFTSTREHAKETPIKKMILEELVRRLKFDPKLKDLNVQLAAADINQTKDNGEQISSLIKKYLKAAGISFEQLTRTVEKWVTVDEDREVPAGKKEPAPIPALEPPTFVRWRFNGPTIKLFPGQRYSYLFETDAAPSYWNPGDQLKSKIRVTSHGARYTGAGEMRGGRVRCHFECPDDSVIGAKGFIQVQLDYALGQAITSSLPLEIVPKPAPRPKPPADTDDVDVDPDGKTTKVIKVKVRKKDFSEVDIPVIPPVAVTRTEPASLWANLGWPADPQRAGFAIRQMSGKIHLYYNAEFPPFLDMKRKMSRRSLEEEFVRRYEMKLVLHTIFSLNYDFVDEEDFPSDQKIRIRNLLCATAESLALATKAELEIEAKVRSEDNTPIESSVAADLSRAALAQGNELVGDAA